ncbi:MAG: DUF4190 domain-containing protein [Anaerolineales bacterium]
MEVRPAPNQLARTSLTLGILGWILYAIQFCFDLTVGLLLTVLTGGAGAVCSTVLDFLVFAVWLGAIVSGHVALGQARRTGAPGRAQAVWGLVLGYTGLAFSIFGLVIIIILVAAGIGVGVLGKFLPVLPRH